MRFEPNILWKPSPLSSYISSEVHIQILSTKILTPASTPNSRLLPQPQNLRLAFSSCFRPNEPPRGERPAQKPNVKPAQRARTRKSSHARTPGGGKERSGIYAQLPRLRELRARVRAEDGPPPLFPRGGECRGSWTVKSYLLKR